MVALATFNRTVQSSNLCKPTNPNGGIRITVNASGSYPEYRGSNPRALMMAMVCRRRRDCPNPLPYDWGRQRAQAVGGADQAGTAGEAAPDGAIFRVVSMWSTCTFSEVVQMRSVRPQ